MFAPWEKKAFAFKSQFSGIFEKVRLRRATKSNETVTAFADPWPEGL